MLVKAGRDHRDAGLVLGILIVHRTKDNIRVIACQLLHKARGLIGLDQADVAGNIDNHMACALDGGLKQRAGYRLLHRLDGLVVALGLADADMGDSLVDHNGLHIRESPD